MRQRAGWKSLPRPVRSTFDLRSGRVPANGVSHLWDAGKRVRASSRAPRRIPHPTGWGILFGMCRSTGELAASTCAKRVKSRGEAGLLRMATAIRGMPGSEFEPRRPLQKEYPIRQDGVFFLECAAAPENSLPRPARSVSNQEVRQGSCEWREPFVGCREASSSLVARSKNTTQRVVFFSLIWPSPPCQEDTK